MPTDDPFAPPPSPTLSTNPPTLANAIADINTAEDAAFSFTVAANTFADLDIDIGDSLSYRAAQSNGAALPTWLSFNPGSRSFSGTPGNGDVGILTIRVTATDGSNASISDDFVLTITNVNDAPIAGSYAHRTAGLGQAVSLNPGMLFSDVDAGDALSFTASRLPAGLAINPGTGVISGTAPSVIGLHHVVVTATDSHAASATLNFDLDVIVGNPLTASVVTRAGLALTGVTVHELISTTPAGSLYSFKNFAIDTNATSGLKTLTADLVTTGNGTEQQAGFSLHGAGGATLQSVQLGSTVNVANGWSIAESTPSNGYTLTASHGSNSIAGNTVIAKLTLALPATAAATGASILDMTAATLGSQSMPSRSMGFSHADLGSSSQESIMLPDSSLALSLSRGTSDYLVNGTTRPITAADALDALKLSVGLAASKGSSWKELISADINHDGRVTAADALEILKVSVGINTIQPGWVFVPSDASFNPTLASMNKSTVSYKDELNLSSITAPTANTFTGILVGDVNNSWLIPA
jgi:hypothetical protein